MPDFTIVAGDTEPLFSDVLTYSNGEAADLTGATVEFVMRSLTATVPQTLTGTVTVTSAKAGAVYFAPSAADSGTPGNYMAQWKVTFSGGEKQSWPTVGYIWVQVQPNLKAASAAQLISIPEVKERLYIPANDRIRDDELLEMVEAVRPLIENLTGPIVPTTYDEWYEGGRSSIALRHQPSYGYGTDPMFFIQAVSEYRGPIEYNLSLVPTPTQGSVYSAMAHGQLGTIVRRTSGGGTYDFWSDPSHPEQSVHVVYTVGQKTVPANVKRAVVETVRWWYQTGENVGRGGLTRADDEPIRPFAAIPYHVEAMLAPTRRHPSFA